MNVAEEETREIGDLRVLAAAVEEKIELMLLEDSCKCSPY